MDRKHNTEAVMEAMVKGSGVGLLRSLDDVERAARLMVASGFFNDTKDVAQAVVKIMAGAEVGLGAYASMTGVHVFLGKPMIGAQMLAGLIKRSGKYDYVVNELSDERCKITFTQHGSVIGVSEFSMADARRAATKNLDKFPRNMLFSRAMMNGARWYCPDVFVGPVEVVEDEEDYAANDSGLGSMPAVVAQIASRPALAATSERPYSPEEFSAQYKLLVAKLEEKGSIASKDQRGWLKMKLGEIFMEVDMDAPPQLRSEPGTSPASQVTGVYPPRTSDTLSLRSKENAVLAALTGDITVTAMTDAQVLALLRVMGIKDGTSAVSDLARAELLGLAVALESVESGEVDFGEDPFGDVEDQEEAHTSPASQGPGVINTFNNERGDK